MILRLAALAAVVGVSGLLTVPMGGSGAPEPSEVRVRIGDNFYRPKRITVPVGTTVVWRNAGRNEHNVLPDRGKRFGIDDIPRGETYAYRFDKPGKYGYYCSFHGAPRTGQFGTVRVITQKEDA